MTTSARSSRIAQLLIGGLLAAGVGSVALVTSQTPASAAACQGCIVVSAPTISLNATARPGLQAVIDQQNGVAIYTPLTTGSVGGPGTVWIVGHRTTHGAVFNRVPFLQPGDPINLIDDAGAHQYIVNRLLVVSESGFRNDVDINDMSRSTLILQTSHPDSHLRYLIEAFGVAPEVCRSNSLVTGFSDLSTATTRFVPIAPQRVLDTRADGAGPVCAGSSVEVPIAGIAGIPANATAVALTVTATETAGAGFVSVGPAGVDPSGTSSVNVSAAGGSRANLVMVAIGLSGRIVLHTSVTTHLVVDVAGYYEPSSSSRAGRFIDVVPERLLDTRSDSLQHKLHANETVTVKLAERASRAPSSQAGAVLVNLTAANGTTPGFLTSWASGTPQPSTSNVNVSAGDVASNLAIVPIGADGAIQLFASTDLDVIIDIVGYFTNESAATSSVGLFVPLAPRRVLDTRNAGTAVPTADATTTFDLLGPTALTGPVTLVTNLTSTGSHGDGFVSITDGSAPSTSNLNVSRGETRANLAVISVRTAERTYVYASLQTQLIVDVTGYFTDDLTPRSKFGSIRLPM